MKRIAGFVLVLFVAVQSQAQAKRIYKRVKQVVTGSAKLSQMHYFPRPWEMDLGIAYRYTNINIKGNSAGITNVEASQKQSIMKASAVLGVFNSVYAELDWDYLASYEVSYSKPSQPTSKSKGMADPTIGAVARLVDADSVKIDLKGKFQASTGDRLDPDSTHDGNAKSGGHAITAGAKMIALITDSSQLGVSLDYTMFALQNSVDQTTKVNYEDDKHNQTVVELSTLTEISSDMFFGVLLEIANTDGYKTTNLNTKSTSDMGSISGKTLNLVGKYEFTPDSLLQLELGYLLDYSQNVSNLDVSATGYSMTAGYLVRF